MNAPTLFDDLNQYRPKPPAQAHSEPSVAAAERAAPTAGTLRAEVLDHIRKQGSYGATDEEIQYALLMNPSTQRPRRVELVRGGYVVAAATTRPTVSGRQATVWVATAKEIA